MCSHVFLCIFPRPPALQRTRGSGMLSALPYPCLSPSAPVPCSQLIRDSGMDFPALPESPYDTFMDVGSGAAAIFGTTGGVMEAALR